MISLQNGAAPRRGAAFAGGLAQSDRRGLSGQAQVAGRRRDHLVARTEGGPAQRPARLGQHMEGKGENDALGEKRDDASVLVIGGLPAVVVRRARGSRPVAVQPLVEVRACGKNGEDQHEGDRQRRDGAGER
jgi:hypothetical protein